MSFDSVPANKLAPAYSKGVLRARRFIELGCSLVLVASGLAHLSNPYHFLESVLRYQLLRGGLAVFVALLLPAVELACGLGLLLLREKTAARVVALTLFFLFSVAQWSAVVRGLPISCGCFGLLSHQVSISSATLVTVAFFAMGAAWYAERRE